RIWEARRVGLVDSPHLFRGLVPASNCSCGIDDDYTGGDGSQNIISLSGQPIHFVVAKVSVLIKLSVLDRESSLSSERGEQSNIVLLNLVTGSPVVGHND